MSLVLSFFHGIGKYSLFVLKAIQSLPFLFLKPHLVVTQMFSIGVTSLPLIIFISVFIGGIIAIQSVSHLGTRIPLQYVGIAAEKSILIELGPILTGIIISGRIGGSITARLGTMVVTEQFDAMRALNLNIFKLLVAPRMVASFVMLPVLTIFASLISTLGALIIVSLLYHLPATSFINGFKQFYEHIDLIIALVKACVFGLIIASLSCYYGYYTQGGPAGVGKSTRQSVLISNILILMASSFISYFLL